MNNPKIVVDSIISDTEKINDNIKIFPMTIRRYAMFEKLNSPFINSEIEFSVNTIIPSVYVMTLTSEKLKEYGSNIEKLKEDSFDWSEDLEMSDVPKMIQVVTQQIININKAAPDNTEKKS
jgi:hypothetical protein